jgi:hypothetical protein
MLRPVKVEFFLTLQEHGVEDTNKPTYIGLRYDLGFFFQNALKVLLRASQTREKFRNIKYSEGSSLNPRNRIPLEKLTVGQLERVGFYAHTHQWRYSMFSKVCSTDFKESATSS